MAWWKKVIPILLGMDEEEVEDIVVASKGSLYEDPKLVDNPMHDILM